MSILRSALKMVVMSAVVAFGVASLAGCGPTMKVSRVAVDETIDLSGNWNDSDSRMVSTDLINDMLQANWIEDYLQTVSAQGGQYQKPVIVVGRVYNNTDEHINPDTFLGDIELAMVNSGRLKVVTNATFRNELAKEMKYQQGGSVDPDTAARIGKQIGANFILFGTISKVRDRWEGKEVVLYKVKLELNNIATAEKAWIGMKDIKKLKNQKKVAW
jgi:penicillin-binding protein activator